MAIVQVVGKASFHSSKKDQDFFVLHCISRQDNVQGFACDTKFVSNELFNKVDLDKQYQIIYDAYSNGRAFITDLREVKSNS